MGVVKMKKLIVFWIVLSFIFSLVSCNNTNIGENNKTETTEATKANETTEENIVCNLTKIELGYCGSPIEKRVTIEDEAILAKLEGFVSVAEGEKSISTKGYYGVTYSLTLHYKNGDILHFHLWSENYYSSSKDVDEEAYQFFYKDDMSEMWDYLHENFPGELWQD